MVNTENVKRPEDNKTYVRIKRYSKEALKTLAEQGLTLVESGKKLGVSRERVRQLFERDGLTKVRVTSRKKLNHERDIKREIFADVLYKTMWKKADEDKPVKKALEYYYGRKKQVSVTLESLIKLFKKYYTAKDRD